MKIIKTSSIFSSNNSIPLIIFVFIFIGVGMFFLIQKTTEKEQKKNDNKKMNSDGESSSVNLEQKIIEESKNISNENNNNNLSNGSNVSLSDNMSNPFSDEVGLFIQRDNNNNNNGNGNTNNNNNKVNINKYAKPQPYIPPFGSGKETRCTVRQVNRPHNTDNVQSTASSNLVKYSSDASY
jgi:hypothetical protein